MTNLNPRIDDNLDIKAHLRNAGLRPTRQRISLAELLFGKGNRHISAEQVLEEAIRANVPVSLATVYNTLHQFTEAGLLREVAVDGTKTYFDTNTNEHHHMYIEDENRVEDIPSNSIKLPDLPKIPNEYELVRVEYVVRVRRKTNQLSTS